MTSRNLFAVSLLSLCSLLVACAGTGAGAYGDAEAGLSDHGSRYAERGELPVGYTVLEHARAGASPLVVKAWYPADTAADASIAYPVALKLPGFGGAVVPFHGQAALDAPPRAGESCPLVVLSHGFSMNPEWYHPLAEHLASRGFVVLAPEHGESDWATDVVAATLARPAEVSATIDLAEEAPLGGIIDAERVAVLGHSYGGYTALAVGGARIDTAALAERCAEVSDPFLAGYFCQPFLAGEAELAAGFGLTEAPGGAEPLWPSVLDPRVDALVPIAGDAYLFGERGLAEVSLPTLLIGGTADTGTPWSWGAGLAFEQLGSEERFVAAFEGGEHMLPVTSCESMPWTDWLPEEYRGYFCADPAWDKEEAQAHIRQLVTAFLLHTLNGEPEARAALTPGAYREVEGLSIRAAGE